MIRTHIVANTVMFAVAKGVSMEQLVAATGVTSADLIEPDAWLPDRCIPAIWRVLKAALPGEAVALQMAAATPFSYFGPLAHACRHAQDIRSSLNIMVEYQTLLANRVQLSWAQQGSECALRLYHPLDIEDGGCGAEVGIGLGFRFGREIIGDDDVHVRVEFAHAPLGPRSAYEAFFSVPVLFERPHSALVFDNAALNRPTPQPDPELFRHIQRHFELTRAQLEAGAAPEDLARIRRAIATNAERGEFGAEALARKVGMSIRKLQRLLSERGTTVRALLDEARQAHAEQLLSDPLLSVEDAAFLLGYSAERAFTRAFKRWTGHTPAQWRRLHRA